MSGTADPDLLLSMNRTDRRPWLVAAVLVAATVAALHAEGRRWWCACGEPWPWITNVWTPHCSQHVADPYSLTHVSHGLIFYGVLVWAWPKGRFGWRLVIAVAFAAGWEVLENSPLIISRYRESTMSLDYLGDSVANAVGDIASCAIGFVLAQRLGLVRSIVLFAATELGLLWLMRDNLTLNVLMLIYPVEAVKHWQTVGHG
jgi:hypothetical protein